MDVSTATRGLAAVQAFAATNVPRELGLEVVFGSGAPRGQLYFMLNGGWYGPSGNLTAVMQPLLRSFSSPHWSNRYPGNYLDSAKQLAGGSLSTVGSDTPGTFYAKSMITPRNAPMTENAMRAFMSYLGNQGTNTSVVRCQVSALYVSGLTAT